MSSKTAILSEISSLKMEVKPLPEIPEFPIYKEKEVAFAEALAGNKGELVSIKELEKLIEASEFNKIYSSSAHFSKYSNCSLPTDIGEFADLDLTILEGQIGTAENGAIWLDDTNLGLRAIPFITKHLVIVLKRKNLVGNLHQTYDMIGSAKSGFGVLIAGPSKTADIEQSLVVGAHGAMSLRVVLV